MLTETLLTIINRNADGIVVIDEDGVIRFVNLAAAALFDKPPMALVGEFVAFPLGTGETVEIDLPRPDGNTIAVEIRVVEIDWIDGRAYLASLRDITERRQAQADIALRNRLIEASGSGIFITGVRGEARPIIYANPAMATITAYTEAELLAQDCRFLWHCNPDDAQNQALDQALIDGAPCTAVIECERADGAMYWAEVRLTPIRDAGSRQLTHFIGVLHDITDRMYLEAERIERERISVALEKERELRVLKDRFLTMMSHELRTPLSLIRLAHDMLRQYGDKATEEERLQYLDSIRTQTEHLTDILSDVMTVSRGDSAEAEFMPEIIDLITYCRDIVEQFQINYFKTHKVEFECDRAVIRAPIDRKLLRQALTNLLSNAIKYSPEGSTVRFTLTSNGHNGNQAIITIQDRGIGITEEDMARLFEPFHRGRNVETVPGTGLGLAIARQAVRAHSGTIAVESAVGQGTTFTLTLPMVEVRARG